MCVCQVRWQTFDHSEWNAKLRGDALAALRAASEGVSPTRLNVPKVGRRDADTTSEVRWVDASQFSEDSHCLSVDLLVHVGIVMRQVELRQDIL